MQDHSAAELNLYLLDFGSETLRAFSKAPHVGDFLLSHEAEKVNNLIKILYPKVEQKKKQIQMRYITLQERQTEKQPHF